MDPPPHPGPGHLVELEVVPGLVPWVLQELAEPGREALEERSAGPDRVTLVCHGPLALVLGLRTVRSAYLLRTFPVPRPRGLLGEEHLRGLVELVSAARLASDQALEGFRFGAAGSDSAVFARLATEVSRRTGLAHRPQEGPLLLRVRPAPAPGGPDARSSSGRPAGWDVLARLGARPLSARPWRVPGFPGALEASVAAAMVRASGPAPGQRFADLCCGSATVLVERALHGPTAAAIGVDWDAGALAAARRNLTSAGREGPLPPGVARAFLARGDVGSLPLRTASLDAACANPPWGHRFGEHRSNEVLYHRLLAEAARAMRPGGRLVLLSHEVQRARAALAAEPAWEVLGEARLALRGHHPRLWTLRRRPG